MRALWQSRESSRPSINAQQPVIDLSTLPIGLDVISTRRALSTTALSATFPFTGSDLPPNDTYGIESVPFASILIDQGESIRNNRSVGR